MVNNDNKSNCGFADEIVSYMYGEIDLSEAQKFETHLIDCSACTDEFAELANARYSVFEWRKEEFAHLATPSFIIPYTPRQNVEDYVSSGFFAGLRGLLSGAVWPVTAVAALVICLGIWFAAMTFLGGGDHQIAANIKIDESSERPVVAAEVPATAVSENAIAAETKKIGPDTREDRLVQAAETGRRKPNRQMTAGTLTRGKRSPQLRQAPVLSDYGDTDDKTLRLSDLFAYEIGGRR